mmetsp:Transcript_16380/g.27925  ORF Transcript_16380/g.27925 Transcript_16380/m.27925 type:complete len:476 (-) Transcript_16380:162-1589(-)
MGSGVSSSYKNMATEYAAVEQAIERGEATWDALTPELEEKMKALVALLEKEAAFDPCEKDLNRRGGETIAMHNLGLLLSRGCTGVPQDDERAVEMWKEASRRGHLDSTYNLAEMLYHDRGVPPVDLAKGGNPYFNQFRAVALWTNCTRRAEGHSISERRLAEAYISGVGVLSVDKEKAAKHYMAASNKSMADAWAEIGEMHEKGIGGFKKNESAAAERYAFSAETGNAKAFFQLGKMYMDGRGVPKDRTKGEALVEASIEAGHSEAQYHNAILCAKRDPFKAIGLLNHAARQGHGKAKAQLERIKNGERIEDDEIVGGGSKGRRALMGKLGKGLGKMVASLSSGDLGAMANQANTAEATAASEAAASALAELELNGTEGDAAEADQTAELEVQDELRRETFGQFLEPSSPKTPGPTAASQFQAPARKQYIEPCSPMSPTASSFNKVLAPVGMNSHSHNLKAVQESGNFPDTWRKK